MNLTSILGRRRGERRRHPRVTVSMRVCCRRVDGERRGGQSVRALDLSRGGMRINAPSWLRRDDVVEVDVGTVALQGIVVGLSTGSSCEGARQAHVVFTGLTPPALRQLDRLVTQGVASV